MSESNFMRRVMLHAAKLKINLYRNNVGMCRTADGRVVTFGLCKGSSDLIGWTAHTVTPADVGRTIAVFTAVETKAKRGQVRPEQTAFLAAVERDGGRAVLLREGEDIEEVLCG